MGWGDAWADCVERPVVQGSGWSLVDPLATVGLNQPYGHVSRLMPILPWYAARKHPYDKKWLRANFAERRSLWLPLEPEPWGRWGVGKVRNQKNHLRLPQVHEKRRLAIIRKVVLNGGGNQIFRRFRRDQRAILGLRDLRGVPNCQCAASRVFGRSFDGVARPERL